MTQKASVSLSINMVVVVVLAFVMLGLMLTLGRNIVDSAQETTDQVSEQTRQDIINKLTRSDEPLYFNQREFTVPFKDQKTISFGVKNTDTLPQDLSIVIEYQGSPLASSSQPIDDAPGTFFWEDGGQYYAAGEGKVFDVQYRAPRAERGTYIFKFILADTSGITLAEQIIFINVD